MSPELVYFAGIILPVATTLTVILSSFFRIAGRMQKKAAAQRRQKEMLARQPAVVREAAVKQRGNWFSMLVERVEGQLQRTGWKMRTGIFMAIPVTLALLGAGVGVLVFKDILLTIAVMVLLVFIPFLILNWGVQNQEQKVASQLSIAINLFAVEMEINKNVREALLKAAEGVNNPLKKYLQNCAQNLSASRHHRLAFERLASDIHCEHSRFWTQMLLAGMENTTIFKLMPRLVIMLNSQRLLQQRNLNQLSGERRIGILLNILIVPGFIATQFLFPDSLGFFKEPFGRIAVILVFLSIAVGILLDQLLRRIDL